MDIKEILEKHKKYLENEEGGERANLSRANLSRAYLSCANLSYANLSYANLSGANLSYANLSRAYLSYANLSGANLSYANLSYANLSGADLSYANLSYANLSGADLSDANLSGAKLSGAEGLIDPSKWMSETFEHDDLGYIVFKAFGDTTYSPPSHWSISERSFIEEVVNPLPTMDCACGINYATTKWILDNYPKSAIWKCRIRWADLPSVVVPYNTDGKARCGRLELLEIVKSD